MRLKPLILLSLAAFGGVAATAARAEVRPNSLFGDNAVLQRGVPLPVWGEAAEGENVSVEFGGQKVSTVAHGGQWRVILKPLKAGGPFSLVIRGNANGFTFNNLLVGDVWVASGQSNMERQLGPRGGQPLIDGWEQEVATADHPQIREFHVPQVPAAAPAMDVHSKWTVCSPQTVRDYSAVGYFFARDLQKAVGVPIGILFSAWGGTVAEAWTSAAALKTRPEFAPAVQQMENAPKTVDHEKALTGFFATRDPGSAPGHGWAAPEFDASAWKMAPGDGYYTPAGPDNFEGIIWTRREFELPANWAGKAATLRLGRVDDNETTFLNGVPIGATEGWDVRRSYPVPANLLQPGRNVLAVRIVNTNGGGGMVPEDARQMQLETAGAQPVSLAGDWRFQTSSPMSQLAGMPARARSNGPNTPTVLFNGMIAPLQPFPVKGAIWYQGEANQDRAEQYKTLFPLMIADWRKNWAVGDFPFLFVQIAPFHGMRPEIREAQFLTLQRSPNTAMAVTTDVGDANNIHPARKAPVGARLALAARALAYGEKIEYSGPLYQAMKVSGNRATLTFTHARNGLEAKDGPLRGFVIAGADGKFVPAQAETQGNNSVVVFSEQVPSPTTVRFGWANVPDGNLFNREGLPASPFRTDDGPRTTRADDSHSRQFREWYQQCDDRVAAMQGQPVDLIFIGDSITQNFIEEPKNGWNLVGKEVWDRHYAHRHALDFGVGADGTQHILWRLENMAVKSFRPKVAVILAGINNAEETPEDIAAGVKAVITKTQSLFPGVKVISVAILPNGRAPEKTARANEIIRTFADNRSVFSLDLSSRMPPIGNGGWRGIGGDKVHVTEEGYEIWASQMEPLLAQLLGG